MRLALPPVLLLTGVVALFFVLDYRDSSGEPHDDGEEVEFEADELEARMFQHEIDHLQGVLMFDRMTPDQRKEALAEFRRLEAQAAPEAERQPLHRRLRLS